MQWIKKSFIQKIKPCSFEFINNKTLRLLFHITSCYKNSPRWDELHFKSPPSRSLENRLSLIDLKSILGTDADVWWNHNNGQRYHLSCFLFICTCYTCGVDTLFLASTSDSKTSHSLSVNIFFWHTSLYVSECCVSESCAIWTRSLIIHQD